MLAEILSNCIRKAEKNNWFPDQVPSSAWYSLLEKNEIDDVVVETILQNI